MEGMDKIQDILITIACWIIGGFLLLLSLTIFLPHGFIFGLLFLLAAIVSIPLTAAKLEQKLKVPLSGIVRFFAVFLLVAIAISTLPPATPTAIDNNTSIAAPPLAVSGSDVIAVPSEPAVTPTPTAAPTPTPTPDNKGKLDILTSPEGATITVDGVSKGSSPIEGLSVDAGTHSVTVYISGYYPQKETVDVANSETKKLLYTLAPEANPSSTLTSTQEETPTPEVTPTSDYDSSLVKNYDMVQNEDISMKALVKPLSAYTPDELNSLPLNVRKVCKVVISPSVSKEELKSTLIQVVMDETSKNNDIDEVAVFAYDRKEEANFAYNLGKVEWCPNGDWSSVTPEIASSNDRSSYKYVFDIKDQVGSIDASGRPTEREYEIYDYFNKCYDIALKNIDLNDPKAIVDEDLIMQEIAGKYGITKEEANGICTKVSIYETR